MTDLNETLSIITLDVNNLNTTVKGRGYQTGFFFKEQDLTIFSLEETHFKYTDTGHK